MQGVRQAEPNLGDVVFVMGLGLLGLITIQLLKANGCLVIGSDLNPGRLKIAKKLGIDQAFLVGKDNIIEDFTKLGFKLKCQKPFAGIKGLKDENFLFKFFINKFLQLMFNLEKPKVMVLIKSVMDRILMKFFGHSILLVFQKT